MTNAGFTPGQLTSIVVIGGTVAAAVINWLRERSKSKGAKDPMKILESELEANRTSNKEITTLFADTQRTLNTTLGDIRVELGKITTKLDRPNP